MTKRSLLVLLLILIAMMAAIFGRTMHASYPDVTVTRTATGFEPQTVTVHVGQAVVFKNDSPAPIWPASDFHPTHTLYPEFDPKGPVAPGASWRFVFGKVGTWTYHDHLSELTRGTVIVEGTPSASALKCKSETASSTASCWADDLTATLKSKGIEAAFDQFRTFYEQDPDFRNINCHDAGHFLGKAAYALYKSDHAVVDRPETSYCGYGFYHGFMEAMLVDEGPGHYEDVRNYCSSLVVGGKLDNRSGACFHGIGHAVFDSLSGSLWGDPARMVASALGTCRTILSDPAEYHQCSTGVFNSLANAMSAHQYELSFNAKDPLAICRMQDVAIQDGCFQEIGIGAIRDAFMDRDTSIRFIKSIGDTAQEGSVLNAYASDEATRHVSDDMPSIGILCRTFSGALQINCIQGVISGLRTAGEPGREYVRVLQYCSLYAPAASRNFCFELGIQQTRSLANDHKAFIEACKTVAPDPAKCGV